MTRQQIYDIALSFSDTLKYTAPNCDIIKIFRDLGGIVLPEKSNNYLEVFKKEKFIVNCTWSMDRFAYAKAIGHYILHSNMGNPLTIKMGSVDRIEIEGNQFAARFLLPQPEFNIKMKEWNSIYRLAVYFDIPVCMVQMIINTAI
jgi:Zn-dependent peptidase ImmA (M78 family)